MLLDAYLILTYIFLNKTHTGNLILHLLTGFFVFDGIKNLFSKMSEISVVRDQSIKLSIGPNVTISEYNDIVSLAERITEKGKKALG